MQRIITPGSTTSTAGESCDEPQPEPPFQGPGMKKRPSRVRRYKTSMTPSIDELKKAPTVREDSDLLADTVDASVDKAPDDQQLHPVQTTQQRHVVKDDLVQKKAEDVQDLAQEKLEVANSEAKQHVLLQAGAPTAANSDALQEIDSADRMNKVACSGREGVTGDVFTHKVQATVAGAAVGTVAGGVSGGGLGAFTGGAVGAACGVVPAFVTFGLSIPVMSAIGVMIGGSVGAVGGGGVGAATGAVIGHGSYVYRREVVEITSQLRTGVGGALTGSCH